MTRTRTKQLMATLMALASSLTLVLAGCTSDPNRPSAVPAGSALPAPPPAATFARSAAAPVTTSSSPPATSGGAPGPAVISAASTGTPQGAAVAWLTALRTASFGDAAGGWVHKVTPYVTASLEISYRKIAASGRGGGADWTTFVQHQCVSTLVNAAGIIPPEAPVSADAAHVQVSGTLATVCRSGTKASTQFLAATVLVIKDHGRWAVAKREF